MTKPRFSFGIMTDCQYTNDDDKDINISGTDEYIHNRYRQSPRKLQEIITEFNKHELAFSVHLGDFIDRDLDEIKNLQAITSQTKVPLWHVLGNHDFLHSEGKIDAVLSAFGIDNKYYSKQVEDFRFIILDTNDLGMIEHPKNSPEWRKGQAFYQKLKATGARNAYPWNGAIGDEQMAWLRQELQDSQAKNQKVLLFSHHPVFPPNGHNALNDIEILTLIDEFDTVVGYMNGHNHLGNYGERKGIPYLTVNGIIEGDDNAFGIVHVFDDFIEVVGYGRLSSYTWPKRTTA